MGYKNDQFFNSSGEDLKNEEFKTKNPSFAGDERNKIRLLKQDNNGAWRQDSVKLERGYIRTLLDHVAGTTGLISTPIIKCNFQFNPQYLQHSVPMRTNLTNLFLQDPAQFSQPVSGEVTFGFELFFDRTYLLNNESEDANSGSGGGSPSEKNIGVLADVRALYNVIGQGLSAEVFDAQKQRALQQAQVQAWEESNQVIADATASGVAPSTYNLRDATKIADSQGFGNIFNKEVNMGNVSFLLPSPVRVVFSSLFMVDGYVTQTDVTYTKFSSTLVPIQCTVALSMQAMYVGFARKTTFLTDNLEKAQAAIEEEIHQAQIDAAEAAKVLRPNITKIIVKPSVDYDIIGLTTKLNGSYNLYSIESLLMQATPQYLAPLIDRTISHPYYLTVGADNVTNINRKMFIDIKKDDGDAVRALFDGANPPSIRFDIKIRTYGPYTESQANDVKNSLANYIPNPSTVLPSSYTSNLPSSINADKFVSEASLASPVISTAEEWDTFRNGNAVTGAIAFQAKKFGFTSSELKTMEGKPERFFAVVTTNSVTFMTAGFSAPAIMFKPSASVEEVAPNNGAISTIELNSI